jgi:proline iminopeptidase
MARAMRDRLIACAAISLSLSACGGSDPAPQATEGFVAADDGVKLYYVSRGSGDDVVVAPMAIYLEDHLAPLAKNRRIVFYDPRNRGRSDAADLSTVSLDRQIADLEALREGLGIEKMALIGWSGLGMEIAVYAIRHPERVTRLVQISPTPPAASIMRESRGAPPNPVDPTAIAELDARAEAGEFDDDPAAHCRLWNALIYPSSFVEPSLAAKVPDVCDHPNEWPKNLWPYFGALLPGFGDYDWREDLKALAAPRLVIHGEEDAIPVAGARAWTQGYENARLVLLSPAGHFPYIEQREATLGAIDAFLGGRWPETAQ